MLLFYARHVEVPKQRVTQIIYHALIVDGIVLAKCDFNQ